MEREVYISLGSNLGDRVHFLKEGLDRIRENMGRVVKQSGIYETEAWGMNDTPPFLNQVVQLETSLPPHPLMFALQKVEEDLGRKKSNTYLSRNLDLDILVYHNIISANLDLILPHPLFHLRNFILAPFAEINQDLIHPVLEKDVKTILSQCQDKMKVDLYRS